MKSVMKINLEGQNACFMHDHFKGVSTFTTSRRNQPITGYISDSCYV